jgi:hypothetical protein
MPNFLKSVVLFAMVAAYEAGTLPVLAQSTAPALRVPAEVGGLIPETTGITDLDSVLEDQPAADTIATVKRGNHTWEGGAIGATSLGLLSLMRSRALCNDNVANRNCTSMLVGGFVMGALVGGVGGLFIGSGIPKHGPEPAP